MNYTKYYIEHLFKDILAHKGLKILRTKLGKPNKLLIAKKKDELSYDLMDYYASSGELLLNWTYPEKDDVVGGLNIVALPHLFDETAMDIIPELVVVNEDLDFYNKKQLSGIFHKIDFFVPEASVGFFSDAQMYRELYYCNRHYFYLLNLSFEQYFKLLCEAKGFAYWQLAIINMEYSYGKVESDWFQEQMPKLFPSFSFDGFIELYQKFKQEYLSANVKNGQ